MQKLDEAFFTQFNSIQKFKKGKLILWPEMQPSGVFYVKSGFIRQHLISKDGKEITVNILKPETYFPMIWALNDTPNIYFYECLTETVLLKAPRNGLVKHLKNNPDLLYDLTKRILSGLGGITKTMEILLTGNAYQQISYIVLVLAKRFGKPVDGKGIIIELPLTHRLIGTLAGLSRESTTIELQKLEKNKIIFKENGSLLIKNMEKLEEESSTDSAENIIL
jgi:CRP-like cAMP-binding protein